MPMLIELIFIDLHKLLQNCRLTASAHDGELQRVMVMAIDPPFVFVI